MSHPAAVGANTRCATTRRQSSPSNRASNCARDSRIVPSCTFGQTQAPCRPARAQSHPKPKSSTGRHVLIGTPPSLRNADQASTRSARSAPERYVRTGNPRAVSRSGSAAVAPRRSCRATQCQDQRSRPLHRNIAGNAQQQIGPDLDRHHPGTTLRATSGRRQRLIHRIG